MNIAYFSISEMRCPDSDNINIENHKVLYARSTNKIHECKVDIILADKVARSVTNFIPSRQDLYS